MIFVILGTQKFQFNRLLQMVDNLIEKKVITEPVFAQVGYSAYQPKYYEYRDFLPEQEFKEKIGSSRLVISHGGIGSMMSCLERGKRVIVVPRNMIHDEHIDNHQYQLASLFKRRGHILMAENEKQLGRAVEEIEQFRPLPYEAQQNHIEKTIEHYMLEGYVVKNKRVLMVGSDMSVKGGIVSVIKNYLGSEGWEDWDTIFVPTHVEGSAFAKLFCFGKALLKIRKVIKKHRIPLVHIHVSERGSFIRKAMILKMAKKRGCKVILHHHGAEFQQYYDGSSEKHKEYIRKVLAQADMNIVLSERSKPMIQNISPQANVKVLYNSVGVTSVNRYNSKARDFIMLGRLEKRKGTFELLETIAKLDDRLPEDMKFHLCGDGDLSKVQEAMDRLQIGHRIGHFGWADAEMKDELLKKSMGHILFSYNEGLPMAILETMGYGIPSISTNVASIPEVVKTDETGILVEAGDKEALAQAILKFAEAEDYRKVLSENAHRLIYEKFSLVNGVRALQAYYEEVIS